MNAHLTVIGETRPGMNTASGTRLTKEQEQHLISAAVAGDVNAFKKLYERHVPKIYALCSRLCADKSQAEDATQEVFIQVWLKLENFRGESQFSTWLYSVAAKVTVSYIRKQKGWWQRFFNIDDTGVQEAGYEVEFADDQLDVLIMKLPERARMVFVLHAIEGYRHAQIAKMLDIAVGTSKAQFHRARRLLEEWLDV